MHAPTCLATYLLLRSLHGKERCFDFSNLWAGLVYAFASAGWVGIVEKIGVIRAEKDRGSYLTDPLLLRGSFVSVAGRYLLIRH